MIRSVRQFLLISLLAGIALASSITAVGNYLLDKKILSPMLDDQLYRTFSFVALTLQNAAASRDTHQQTAVNLNKITHSGSGKLFFAVFTPQKALLFHSEPTPTVPSKSVRPGFTDMEISSVNWRIYSDTDPVTQNHILVGESYETRDHLVDSIAKNNIYILLFTYPFFGFLVWIIVIVALRSVTRVTGEISSRAPTWLEPVPTENIPVEIQPLVSELNQLFARVRLAFDRSRRFAGDAAHELRTPLAAIQTQAQVALRSEQTPDREEALKKVIQGVNRASHIINQLLTLSRLGHEEELNDTGPLDLHKLATESLASLIPAAREKNITVTLEAPHAARQIIGNDIALDILMRNVIDNAIRYTPNDGTVDVAILNNAGKVVFQVTDSGPGIPPDLHSNVFDRFYRVIGNSEQGSGLGLAIVLQIAKLHHAEVSLKTPKNGTGLIFCVEFPGVSA